ncbi:MAG: diacylglycerol kinase family lipid kinase [Hyphomicrobiales bacterium]|nr:diacylglycerol kinase family lipid kinase [Hyphomicrobiales bacterium]
MRRTGATVSRGAGWVMAEADTGESGAGQPGRGDGAALRSVLIFANPAAGGFRRRRVEAVAAGLRAIGVACDIVVTVRAGELAERLSGSAALPDAVAVHGGDGSIAEAVAGLHRRAAPRPPLVVIPGGTANVLAHEFALPAHARAIVAAVAGGARRPLYYALANGRPFILMASAGFDAAAVHRVSPRVKRRVGKLAYAVAALETLRAERGCDLTIETQGGAIGARLAVVANSSRYGGRYVIARETAADREGLSLVVVRRDDIGGLFAVGRSLVRDAAPDPALLSERRVGKVVIAADRPVPVQIDGDAFGFTPVEIEPVAEPLAIIAPR